ncbi:carboxymuconolactone decarboxylase family protein [Amycolatopsis sp. FDAARGOS 1241]|uniref:carboxymuconolactone decarboxylase family protein n=1 Tax=Amycolatopsis sp. FDAARGOS 1241 TaxID=2778070 RepID=UPI001EF37F08|nr:carboxymuconolactone decarboxylase family protein [Amycolatopsis sp. FDAARGOS 1241]
MTKTVHNGAIPDATIALVQLRAGQLVGSTYHAVRQTGLLRNAGEPEDRITVLSSWRDSPYFTEAERLALELTEAVLTPSPRGERVPDVLFARAVAGYDDKAARDADRGDRADRLLHPGGSDRETDPGAAAGEELQPGRTGVSGRFPGNLRPSPRGGFAWRTTRT